MGIEGNRDEAARCKSVAVQAMKAGDVEKALRLMEKAHRMAPSGDTAALIRTLKSQQTNGDTKGDEAPRRSETPKPHQRRVPKEASPTPAAGPPPSAAASSGRPPPKEGVDYQRDQEELCQRILKTKCYYGVLEVEKTANEEVIKKAYRKLALKLHPDKNRAPSAEEAFKKVSKVFQCLSDASKRAMYDQFGNEDDVPQQYRRQYEADVLSPEELFEAFFGMDLGGGGRRVFRRVRRPAPTDQQQRLYSLLQMLPVFLLVAVTLVGNIYSPSSTPSVYDFRQSSEFPVPRRTASLQVPYFVGSSFPNSYPENSGKLRDLEVQVEMYHFSSDCAREQQRLMQQAQYLRYYPTSQRELRRRLEELRREERNHPSCIKFRKLKERYPNRHHASRQYMGEIL